MKFLDTSIENVERIKEGRDSINMGILGLIIIWICFSVFSLILYFIGYYFSAIWFGVFCVEYIVLIGWLVLKRESYSLAILIKEEK